MGRLAAARGSTVSLVVCVLCVAALSACRDADVSENADRSSHDARLAQAQRFVEQRRFRAAQAELDALLAESPKDVAALDAKVAVLRALGLERQALAIVEELRGLAPDEPRFAYEAGELAARVGDAKLAHEQFAAAHQLAPDDWRPDVAEAALLLNEKPPKLDAADALLARWLDGPGARVEARFHHALVVQEHAREESRGHGGNRSEAAASEAASGDAVLTAFESALELDPRHLPTLCAIAQIEETRGNAKRALDLLDRAKKAADPSDVALEQELDRRIARLTPAKPLQRVP